MFKWKSVKSGLLQASILGPILSNMFINDIYSASSKLMHVISSWVRLMLEGRDAIQRTLANWGIGSWSSTKLSATSITRTGAIININTDWMLNCWQHSCAEGPEDPGGGKNRYGSLLHICTPKSQLCPGFKKKKKLGTLGHEGGDSPTLHHSFKTWAGVRYPTLCSSLKTEKTRNGPIRAGPDYSHKSDQWNTYPQKKGWGSVGAFKPGEDFKKTFLWLLIYNRGLWGRNRQRNTLLRSLVEKGQYFLRC